MSKTTKEGICEQCKKQFTYVPKNRKGRFCSKGCFKAFKRNKIEMPLYVSDKESQSQPEVVEELAVQKMDKSTWEVMVDKLRGIFRK